MTTPGAAVRTWILHALGGWNRFWFTPALPHTLALMRMLAGAMILYTHLVWTLDLSAFLGPDSWITGDVARQVHAANAERMGASASLAWSHLWYIESPAVLWAAHVAALAVLAMFMLGLFTRVTSILTWLLVVSYCHRLTGSLFGLDQINAMLAMYLMLAPCGSVWSLDRWLARRRGGKLSPVAATVSANVATRLIQLHMCVIYLFGGIAKMRGVTWWDGSAMWLSVANYEYQSLDMTWLVHVPLLVSLLTHMTVFWEAFYCALVWPRLTRPLILLMAVAVHGGIALFLGMITFGLVMLIGNLAFIAPETVERCRISLVRGLGRWRAGQGSAAVPVPTSARAGHPAGQRSGK
jgi:hypothetical protein